VVFEVSHSYNQFCCYVTYQVRSFHWIPRRTFPTFVHVQGGSFVVLATKTSDTTLQNVTTCVNQECTGLDGDQNKVACWPFYPGVTIGDWI
jgi:hypothetical protein